MINYNIFFTSDTHFSHANAITFLNWDGSRMRPFDTWKEADEKMIDNWNKVVRPQDKVYHAGDLVMGRKDRAEEIMRRLNGRIHLIMGNHDIWKSAWYLKYCYQISGSKNLDSFLITHIPVHSDSKARFKLNLHGHIHGNEVYLHNNKGIPMRDPWYFNLCVDYKYRYAPIPYEEVQEYYQNCLDKGLLAPIPPRNKVT